MCIVFSWQTETSFIFINLLSLNTFDLTQCLVVTTLTKEEKEITVWEVNFPVVVGYVLILGRRNCLAGPQMT